MTKWLTLIALAGGLLACAESQQTAEVDEQPEQDAPAKVGASDTADVLKFQFGGSAKLSNVGAVCSANTDCKGSAAHCITSVPLINTPLEQGHCTANCTRDSECGTGGGCPLAQIASLAKLFVPDAGAMAGSLSICLPKCKSNADCSADLPCQDIPIPNFPPLLTAPNSKYCMPPQPKLVDGGVLLPDGGFIPITDAGIRLPDGGTLAIPALPAGGSIPGLSGLSGLSGLLGN